LELLGEKPLAKGVPNIIKLLHSFILKNILHLF